MARAKSTARAEARRRYRAATAAAEVDAPDLAAPAAGASPRGGGARPASSGRPGLFSSFRDAIRPVNLRDDLADLPRLATKTFAIWLPALILLVSFGLTEAAGASLPSQTIPYYAFNLFLAPPPLAVAFLAGILTQRSSYLAGGVIGLLDGILIAIYALTATIPTASGVAVTSDLRLQYVLYGLVVSPVAGVAVGGFSGFYRRFLRMANPNAGNRSAARSSKPATRRR